MVTGKSGEIAREHVAWALSHGRTLLDIAESVSARHNWIYPTEQETIEAVAIAWLRIRPLGMREAA